MILQTSVNKRLGTLCLLALLYAAPQISNAHLVVGNSHSNGNGSDAGAEHAAHLPAPREFEHFLKLYSQTGDDALLGRARELLTPISASSTGQDYIRAAWLEQAEHRFALAKEYLQVARRLEPRNPQVSLLEASVAASMGDHKAAAAACRRLILQTHSALALACAVRADHSVIDQEQSLRALEQAQHLVTSAELKAWYLSVMADAEQRSGRLEQAIELYRTSLSLNDSVQVRAALVDALLGESLFEQAEAELADRGSAPAYVIRRIIALKAQGHRYESMADSVNEQFRSWMNDNDYRHGREMARFYLDVLNSPALALSVAEMNVSIQREPEDLALLRRARLALASQ